MGITNTEYLEDKVRVHYILQKPWGVEDENCSVEILYENVLGMHPIPAEFPITGIPVNREIERVNIPNLGRDIVLVFEKYSEKSAGPAEEDLVGVYLA